MQVVLISGMSGAGKSTALHMLEDMGFEAVDNLPMSLIPSVCKDTEVQRLAIGVDVRSRDFSVEEFTSVIGKLRGQAEVMLDIIMLTSDDAVLTRRFSETRRRHPLAQDRPVEDGLVEERALIMPLFGLATTLIDTTDFSSADLRRVLTERYDAKRQGLTLTVISFSYAKGLPRDADLVFDARFLQNPHYQEHLRPLTGQNKDVGKYISQDKGFAPFVGGLQGWLAPLLPRYKEEGKSYLTLAFGCTGGKHRSVFVAEEMTGWLRGQGYEVTLRHRDVPLS